MEGYLRSLLIKYSHPTSSTLQISPLNSITIQYGTKVQHSSTPGTIALLYDAGVKCIQYIVGALLWYSHSTDNKLIVSLNAIGIKQDAATKDTNDAINQLLDYITT